MNERDRHNAHGGVAPVTAARTGAESWPAVADPWAKAAAQVATELDVDPTRGLTTADAEMRAERVGPNALEEHAHPSVWRMVLRSATEPFVILLAVAGLGAVLLGEVRDGLLILGGLIPIVVADVVTEYRGERALEALRAASAPEARVRRDAVAVDLPAAAIVPGDVVLLRVGDVVPADLRLTKSERLVLDRSILTGESIPERAAVEPDGVDTALADRRSIAYSGTSVVAGRGEGVVISTGAITEVGRIASGLTTGERRRSPLQRELDRLVRILLVVAIGLIAITMGLGFARGNSIGENLLAGISAAIAAIPEEPPVLLAVILGLGAYRLLKRGVLVRRLNAEEILGAIDLVITDKTGTLTQNRLEVASIADPDGSIAHHDRRLEVLTLALRAEDDAWQHAEGVGVNSFTRVLARSVDELGGSSKLDATELLSAEPATDSQPFAVTTSRRDGRLERVALGAPETVADLALGTDSLARARWHDAIERAATNGERIVGLARWDAENRATMEALIGFADPLRAGIGEATAAARGAGIQVIVVTGDHQTTAGAIARQAGISDGRLVTGTELASWGDPELGAHLPELSVVARSTPDQKRRIVEVARANGRQVAVTGDGVNDAPALHGADVAVAMGSGTAVAKEASDMVLGDDSFATLIYGIAEGRRIVDNVLKGLIFLLSTHVAMLGFLLIATVYGFSQPLLPIQILWLELFIDLSASIAFEREPAEPDIMTRRPRVVARPLLTNELLGRIVAAGAFTAVAALWLMTRSDDTFEHARWLAYTTLVCAQAVRAYSNRSLREPLYRLGTNGFLLATAIAAILIQAAIPYVPALAEAFRATTLSGIDWILIGVIALAPAILAQVIRAVRHTDWVA